MFFLLFTFIGCIYGQTVNPWYGCPQDRQGRSGIYIYKYTLVYFHPDCPTGWIPFDSNCYAFVSFPPATFTGAQSDCLVFRGTLIYSS